MRTELTAVAEENSLTRPCPPATAIQYNSLMLATSRRKEHPCSLLYRSSLLIQFAIDVFRASWLMTLLMGTDGHDVRRRKKQAWPRARECNSCELDCWAAGGEEADTGNEDGSAAQENRGAALACVVTKRRRVAMESERAVCEGFAEARGLARDEASGQESTK